MVSQQPTLSPSWRAIQAREPEALEALFADWSPTVLQWCRRLGGPKVDAEQAAQEVLIVVLRKLGTVRNEKVLPSWIYSVCRRTASAHRREAFTRRWDADVEPTAGAVVMDMEGRDALQQAWGLLEELPEDLREVLVLCDLEQRTDTEAAELIGCPVGTAKSRLRRARASFRHAAAARGLRGGRDD
ncbi:MAG: RNA polymerase sigma factor [Proteobacteria bacterium]|nr:RNA polymerase sigma factor [Pseudomonadota bacterium]MCP4919942.1 RNA polymerase sigma factor [Pseudomonadota bacterium]